MSTQLRTEKKKQISGLLTSEEDFRELLWGLEQRDYGSNDVSVLMSEGTHHLYFTAKENTKTSEGAAIGGVSGALLGILIGGVTLAGNIFAPGIGLVVSGAAAGILAGGAVGGAAGSLLGALVGAGIPEHEAKFFEDALREKGRILVVVNAREAEVPELEALFQRTHAEQIKTFRP